jgi:NTE family protein
MLFRPDVLVLGGGGVLGERWLMGVLAGIEDATGFDLRHCEYFVGTSAGSIIAARLAAGISPSRPQTTGVELAPVSPRVASSPALATARRAGRLTFAAWSPVVPLALAAGGPPGALLRAALLSRAPRPTRTLDDLGEYIERQAARFDGRLRITTVDRHRGRRVVFGSPGAPYGTVARAVQASCAVPWIFAPVMIGGEEYVDGGVWSATNLDVAPASRDTHVLCLNPTAGINGTHPVFTIARRVARSAAGLEAASLRRRGAIVQTIGPDIDAAAAMGSDFMDSTPRAEVLAAGYRQGLALAQTSTVR